jgi:hypothetical protein
MRLAPTAGRHVPGNSFLGLFRDLGNRFRVTFAARISLVAILLAEVVPASRGIAQQTAYSHGDPTAVEQQMLELINRARMNPTQEGIILDSLDTWYSRDARTRKPWFFTNLRAEFASYPAAPPLAFHPTLLQAARAHSADMVARNFFDHVNPSGQDPTARASAIGYDAGVGENITGAGATNADEVLHNHFGLLVDYDNIDTAHPLGHRLNVLSTTYSEAGMGLAGVYYGGRITQDFGTAARAYILGVAYNDANGNGAYDLGEGLAGISVRPNIGNWYAVTSASGGFAIPIDAIETVSDNVSLPFPVNGTPWSSVEPYDTAYRQQQIQAAPSLGVTLTWSGGSLSSPRTSSVTIKRPVRRNYRLTGTDGWFYNRSMVTAQNAKADLAASVVITTVPGRRDLSGDTVDDLVLQNGSGQILVWQLDGFGRIGGGFWVYGGGLGDWKVVAVADISGDAFTDLILQNNAGQTLAWLTNGSGAVTSGIWLFQSGLGDWRVVGVADINRDGAADIILQNSAGLILARLTDGRGTPTSWVWVSQNALGDWKVVGVTDMDGDAINDVAFQNAAGQLVVWRLDGTGTPVNLTTGQGLKAGSGFLYSGALGPWRVATVSDMNRDGIPDLVMQYPSGQILAWLLDGTATAVNPGTGAGLKPGSGYIYSGGLGDWRVR